MLTLLKYIFILLGIVFLAILLVAGYFFFFTPLGDIIQGAIDVPAIISPEGAAGAEGQGEVVDKNPLLNEGQEEALQGIGVDPGKLPSEITPQMEECFTEKLGAERVAEIQAGDSPSPLEFFKAQSCL